MINLSAWYKKRGARFVFERARRLLERYSISPQKSIKRIRDCVERLGQLNCKPTFFVPAIVGRRNPQFIRELAAAGCEIGIHGYQHVDMRTIPAGNARQQLMKAKEMFLRIGIRSNGFRCPYLSISDELIHELPLDQFDYSSNRAIFWPTTGKTQTKNNLLYETINGFYNPEDAESTLCLPWRNEEILEIPVCVPDDLLLRDGLHFSNEEVYEYFERTFEKIHSRGELFNIMFHPELATWLGEPFRRLLEKAQNLPNEVWITQLHEVSKWWKEKEKFWISLEKQDGLFQIQFHCSPRATLLIRGYPKNFNFLPWDKKYLVLKLEPSPFVFEKLPLIGLEPDLPEWVQPALTRLGFITVVGDFVGDCSIIIDKNLVKHLKNPVELVDAIEKEEVFIIRYWPWPDGHRSAMCLTGDLDALSLLDYATRLLPF